MTKPALLVIDVQQAMCAGDDAAFDIDTVIDRINALSARARAAGAPVVLVQHEEDDGPLQVDTDGWQLATRLATGPEDLRVRKRTTDSFYQTDLLALLQAQGITDLVVCGLQSEYCVDSTVRRALSLGYQVVLVTDAHSTMDNRVLSAAQITAHQNATLANLTSEGRRVTPALAGAVRL